MAIIFTDGCDSYGTYNDTIYKWDAVGTATFSGFSATTGRFGGGCLTGVSSTSTYMYAKTFPLTGTATTTDEFYAGFSATLGTTPSSLLTWCALLNNAATPSGTFSSTDAPTALSLRITTSRTLAIYRGSTLLASGATVLPTISWFRVEVRVVVGNSGVFEVRLNGVPEITFAGDTYDAGDVGIRQFAFCTPGGASRLDDIVLWNSQSFSTEPTSWMGDMRIETIRPTAAGDVTNSTPLSGAAWDAVNDVGTDGDTTYTQAGTALNKDLYQCSDLSETPDSIITVMVNALMKTTGTTGRTVKLKVKHTNEDTGPARGVTLSVYGLLQASFPYDPADFGAWTGADVNALQIGWEVDT